jgi:hypothetical protein
MTRDKAEILAIKALSWAASTDFLARFVDAAGIGIADIRARADDPELLAALLDFVLADDRVLTEFCAAGEVTPREVHAARQALPGAAPEYST